MLEHDLRLPEVIAGTHRLSPQDALRLYREATLPQLGRWSSAMAARIHGGPGSARTYVIDRNINYSNVCSAHCTFCAFKRDLGDADAYVLSQAQIDQKVAELVAIGGTQILLQGGMHPELPLAWYTDLLRHLKNKFPGVHLHAFSPPEIVEFVAVLDLPGFPKTAPGQGDTLPREIWLAKLDAVLKALMAAGLDSLPGGGGEIFLPHVRRRIGPGKADGRQWLDVMGAAHRLGMQTSATMMFGHIEGVADRIGHMALIRERQDQAIEQKWPGRYLSFIAWPFQRDNTALGDLPDYDFESGQPFPGDVLADAVLAGQVDPDDKKSCGTCAPKAGKMLRMAGAAEYLRMSAISRLFLDNIHSIGSSWVTMGPHTGQLALFYGASDMGSVMMEENVVSSAGTTHCLDEPLICRLVRDAGFVPAQRDNAYRILKIQDGPDASDLRMTNWATQRQALHREKKTEALGKAALTVGATGGSALADHE